MLRTLSRASRHVFLLIGALLVLLPAAYAASPAPTRVTLSASSQDQGTGEALTATIRTATGGPVNAGTVDFLLPNGQALGSALVDAQGTATLALPQTTPGSSVTAAYHSGVNSSLFLDGRSPAIALPAATTLPDFTVTAGPATVTTTQGSYGTTAITIASVAGYAGSMEFSCSNLPAQVTCAFNPIQQSLAADGSFVSTLELQTQAASGEQSRLWSRGGAVAYALVVPGALALFGLTRRRRGQWLAAALLLVTAVAGLSGCSQRYGYLHHPPPVAGGTPVGTYTITVAVDGSVGATVTEHDIPITLVVQ